MSHWRSNPASWCCCNGHTYSHPAQKRMSVFFGGSSCLTVYMACHRCSPVTYAVGVSYNVKPLPMVYWYGCDQETFTNAREMDEQEIELMKILDYITTTRAA